MTAYLTAIDSISLSRTVFEIFDFKVFRVWPWPLNPKGPLGSKKFTQFEKAKYDFLFDFYGHHLSISYRFGDIRLQSFQGLTLTFDHLGWSGVQKNLYHSKGHIWLFFGLIWTPSLYLVPFSRYTTSKFSGFDLDLWPLKVIWVKKIYTIRKAIYDFLFDFYGHHLYPIPIWRYPTSKFSGFDLDLWPLKVIWGQKKFIPFERPYMTSYLTSMDIISLSRTVFEIFDFKVFRVWPWPMTPKGHPGSKKIIPFERPYMTSYLTSMCTISLSRTVLEIFDFKVFRVWPWPLSPKGHLGSKKFMPFEKPYMTSYLTSMDTISLSRTVFEIFDFKVFRVWPWPLTPKGHLGSKIFILFERPYMTSYLTSMGTISLSRTVFEIFDFKVFRVWPWPLTPKGHLGSKKCMPFERPYMTSYLTFMDTISLSTVFEIFDFKIFRVWPWPLTPKGHLSSTKFIPFERPYMTSYLTSMDTISLSRTVFEIMPVKILKAEQNGGFRPFKGQGQGSIFFYYRKGSSSHQTASFEILRIKIGSAV